MKRDKSSRTRICRHDCWLGELMFEFEAAIQVRAASLEEAEKAADEYLGTTPEGARIIRVNTDAYPEVFRLDEDGEIEEQVPEYEIDELGKEPTDG